MGGLFTGNKKSSGAKDDGTADGLFIDESMLEDDWDPEKHEVSLLI